MTIEDALKAMACIEGLYDGTQKGAEMIGRLVVELIERPDTFWEVYFETVSADNPTRKQAETLMRGGKITPATTFGQALHILTRAGDEKR
jgi:hypothetical protein